MICEQTCKIHQAKIAIGKWGNLFDAGVLGQLPLDLLYKAHG